MQTPAWDFALRKVCSKGASAPTPRNSPRTSCEMPKAMPRDSTMDMRLRLGTSAAVHAIRWAQSTGVELEALLAGTTQSESKKMRTELRTEELPLYLSCCLER